MTNWPAPASGKDAPPVNSLVKLSVVMPVYNERATLRAVVERVLALPLEIEMICVDDGSNDGSVELLKELEGLYPKLRVFFSPATWAKALRFAAESQKQPAILLSSRTRTSNTIPRICISFLSLLLGVKPMSSMVRALWGGTARVLYFWHSSATGCSLCFELSDEHQPHRHGNLLQDVSPRDHPVDSH